MTDTKAVIRRLLRISPFWVDSSHFDNDHALRYPHPRMTILRRHPLTAALPALVLALQACQSPEPSSPAPGSLRSGKGEEWVIAGPGDRDSVPAPANGSRSFRAGVTWMTDGIERTPCRYWIDLEWRPELRAYVSIGRLPLPLDRPSKMELLLDARPWLVGNEVRALVEPMAAPEDAGLSAGPLREGRWFERAGRDYAVGPHVGVTLRRGETDLMDSGRGRQDVRITVRDPERSETLFVALLGLSQSANAPGCR